MFILVQTIKLGYVSAVLWRMFSPMKDVQYCGDTISTLGDTISAVKGIQFCRGIAIIQFNDVILFN